MLKLIRNGLVYSPDKLGKKDILIAGLVIMGISTLFLPFLGQNVVAWTLLLFLTRCGAALVEIMTESYFFKHAKGKNSNIIGFFRTAVPTSYIVAPVVATLFLLIFPLHLLIFQMFLKKIFYHLLKPFVLLRLEL